MVKCGDMMRLCESQKNVLAVTFIVVLALFTILFLTVSLRPPTDVNILAVQANGTANESAKFKAEINRDFLIFWAIIFFTCITGIIALLQHLKTVQTGTERALFLILYFGLVLGVLVSMTTSWNIIRESQEFTRRGLLGLDFQQYMQKNKSMFELLSFENTLWWGSIVISVGIFLQSLYFAAIGWLRWRELAKLAKR